MKKFYLMLSAVALSASPLYASFDDIYWTSGPWGYQNEIENFTLPQIGSINGQVLDVTDLIVPDPYGEDPENPGVAKKITIVGPASYGTRETYIYKVKGEGAENNTFRFGVSKYSAPERTPGDYVVSFPQGCMYGDGQANPAFTVTFKVKDESVYTPVEIAYTSDPQTELPVSSIEKIKLSFSCRWQEGEEGGVAGSEKFAAKGINPEKSVTLTNTVTGNVIPCTIVSTYSYTDQLAYAVTPASPVTVSGTYRLNVPEDVIRLTMLGGTPGAYTEENVCNTAINFTYIVDSSLSEDSLRPRIFPAPGEVAALSKLEFYTPEGYNLYLPDTPLAATLTLPSGSTVVVTPYTNINVEGEMAFINLPETYRTPGTYTFSFPRGCFEFAPGGNQLIASDPFSISYTVVTTTPGDFSYTTNPENNTTVYFLQNVFVTFDETVSGVTGVAPLCYRPDGTRIENATMSFNSTYNRLLIDLRYPTDYGTYKVIVPAGAVMNDSHQVNSQIELQFTLAKREVTDVDFMVFPAEGYVERLRAIEIEAPSTYASMSRMDQGLTYVTFQVGDKTWKEYVSETNDPLICRVELSPVSEGRPELNPGDEVNMIVGEGAFMLAEPSGIQVLNALKVYSWIMGGAGVEDVLAGAESADVYSLQGFKVISGASAAELKNLKGIYIVNGRKVRF